MSDSNQGQPVWASNLNPLLLQNIKIIDGFIAPYEIDLFKSSFVNQSDKPWHSDDGLVSTYELLQTSFGAGVIYNRLTPFMSAAYGKRLDVFVQPYMRKYEEGSSLSYHIDGEGEDAFGPLPLASYSDTYESCVSMIEYAANIYLNDNFDGGEIIFHKLGISIKPKAGQLIMFPSGAEYAHSVNRINLGERLTVVVFYTSSKLKAFYEKFTQNQSV